MIVYLDQNKWIELARIYNGLDKSDKSFSLIKDINTSLDKGYIFPLSAIHILEFSRIKDASRRSRLGNIMWNISKGKTLAPHNEIICREIEIALLEMGLDVTPRDFNFIGKGIPHTFGEKHESPIYTMFAEEIDKAMLVGSKGFNIDPVQFSSQKHRKNFQNHLHSIKNIKDELPKEKWDNYLYATAMMDIIEPLNEVMSKFKIPNSIMENWTEKQYKEFIDKIPTRKLDIHLHRQVLKNSQYKAKISDLEDWAGLGTAMCYCDVVICEKHFADLVSRDNYHVKARIETSIYEIFK